MNFAIKIFLYTADMAEPGSQKFNATESILQKLLNHLFPKTNIGSHYSGCKLTLLRFVKKVFEVKVICLYWKSPTLLSLDEKHLYRTIRKHTRGITRLGPYVMSKKSLYINGERPALPRT
ncbi:mucin-16-like [Petaurus breviceps papuanus]|uniref:mucin-16-like n=1 Tax=Petaurus breviceps papuanus TaxID=3040969 RepID=UPI0036DF898B